MFVIWTDGFGCCLFGCCYRYVTATVTVGFATAPPAYAPLPACCVFPLRRLLLLHALHLAPARFLRTRVYVPTGVARACLCILLRCAPPARTTTALYRLHYALLCGCGMATTRRFPFAVLFAVALRVF